METQREKWQNLKGNVFSKPIVELVEETIIREKENGNEIRICIGADSHVYGDFISYATAIVFVRKRKGAFAFVRKDKVLQNISIKERMLNEVNKSVEIAYLISPVLEKYGVEMEVHADINTDSESNPIQH